MLGNRGTPNFTRTTSMTEFTLDVEAPPPPPVAMTGGDVLSPRYLRQNSPGDYYVQTADFLRCCGLCNRRLAPARDIFMYRGDTAFCSQECREQQMKQDERKERRAAMKKGESHHPGVVAATASPEAETVAAA